MKIVQKLVFLALLFSFNATLQARELRIGTTLWPGYEPLYLAEHIDAYQQNARIINYPSTSEVLRAFKNKALEAAALTLDEVAALVEQEIPISVILVCDISDGADVIMAHPSIGNMQDLKGKRVAVESTAVGAYVLSRALEVHNIGFTDITLVNAENSDHFTTYKNNEADAVVTYEPVRTRLLRAGANEIFNTKEIPGEVVDVLVVHNDYLESHKKSILDMTSAWFKALDFMQDNPKAAYSYIASRHKITSQEVEASFDGLKLPDLKENKQLLSGKYPPLQTTLDKLAILMKEGGILISNIDTNGVITPEFLPGK